MKLRNLKKQALSHLEQYKSQSPATYAAAQQAVGGLLILDGFTGIDNPVGANKRSGIFGSLAGIVMGIIFIFVPTIFGNVSGTNKMTANTNATIVSVNKDNSTTTNSDGSRDTSTSCTAVAKYNVDGKAYNQQAAFGSSSMCSLVPGQTTQINYNPDRPGQWGTDIKTIGLFLKVFFVVGILITITALVTAIIRLLEIIYGWKLLKSGRALAKTLPQGTDLSSVIEQVRNNFKTSLFGFAATTAVPVAQVPLTPTQYQPPAPAPPQYPQPQTQQPVAPTTPPINPIPPPAPPKQQNTPDGPSQSDDQTNQ